LIGINYTETDKDKWLGVDLLTGLGAQDVNVTSRITTFNDPTSDAHKVRAHVHYVYNARVWYVWYGIELSSLYPIIEDNFMPYG